ncbi:prenyltransferase [Arcanobacterium phocisimile]|uniref:Prenyltransferase n=1 Tax=Arcanobacterium phocisimile TaxID=1302235 RepID=A0ABX7IFM4_9ACTO|nr:prenyltransferase [Arcanobacterium phocisimile]QRV01757.1 prenyltransferase [Arcanobacterium phocisimile]
MKSLPNSANPSLWWVLFETSRPLSWINTAYPFAIAYGLQSSRIDWYLILGTLFFLIPYNLFMYGVNDVFDYESDLQNPRKGGVEGALVARRFHQQILWAVVITTTIPTLILLFGASIWTGLVLLYVLFMVAAYSAKYLRFKEVPFLDSFTSSTHFVGPAVVGLLAAASRYPDVQISEASWLGIAAFFLWGMASQAFGAVQDVIPDRQGSIRSIATQIGAAHTVRTAIALYLLSAALLVLRGGAGLWVCPLVLVYALNILPWVSVSDAQSGRTHSGWVRFLWLNYVVGFLLTLVIISAVQGWIAG